VTETRLIDIEFTGFSDSSMPIQIAWTDDDGNVVSIFIKYEDSYLEQIWSDDAAFVHGITKMFLIKHGISPKEACEFMNEMNHGLVLYSDAASIDGEQMSRLFDFAGIKPAFEISDIHLNSGNKTYDAQVFEEKRNKMFATLGITPHFASHDVLVNYKILSKKEMDSEKE